MSDNWSHSRFTKNMIAYPQYAMAAHTLFSPVSEKALHSDPTNASIHTKNPFHVE